MEIIKLVQSISNPFLDVLFQLITMVGEDTFFIFITAVIYWCIDKDMGYKLGFATLTSATINFGLKDLLKIQRPIGESGIRSLRVHTAEGYSFPSGHTQNTAALWTFFMLQLKKWWMYVTGICIIILVGVSRLYLGVHTPIDVIGGMVIGSVWVAFWLALYDSAIKRKDKSPVIAIVVLAFVGLFIFKDLNYYKVVGALTGLLAGYIIEPRFINFNEKASLPFQGAKVSFGLLVLYILRAILKSVLPAVLLSEFIRYLLLLIWITIAAPYIFTKIIGNKK